MAEEKEHTHRFILRPAMVIGAAFLVRAPVEIITIIRIQMIKIRDADDQTQQGYAERDQETREE